MTPGATFRHKLMGDGPYYSSSLGGITEHMLYAHSKRSH